MTVGTPIMLHSGRPAYGEHMNILRIHHLELVARMDTVLEELSCVPGVFTEKRMKLIDIKQMYGNPEFIPDDLKDYTHMEHMAWIFCDTLESISKQIDVDEYGGRCQTLCDIETGFSLNANEDKVYVGVPGMDMFKGQEAGFKLFNDKAKDFIG